jgi:(4S)-4-hydroxy-5-phosphonooxypentane-2,3-dione isomerase
MHILIVHARVKAEFIDAFKQATAINAENSAKEPGVARFDFLQQQDDLSKFVLYEVYRDDDAPAKHKQTAHYNAWVEQVSHMFQEPRTRAFYTNVFPAGEAW